MEAMNATRSRKRLVIAPDLHARLKVRAAREGVKLEETARQVIEAGLEAESERRAKKGGRK